MRERSVPDREESGMDGGVTGLQGMPIFHFYGAEDPSCQRLGAPALYERQHTWHVHYVDANPKDRHDACMQTLRCVARRGGG